MGEQAVTGAGGGPAPEQITDTAGEDAAAGTGSEAPDEPQSRTTDIVPGPGGVMTDEVGVVTGELTLRTEFTGGEVVLHVQYKDADEWYTVTGAKAPLADPAGLDAVHSIAVALLNRPNG